MPVSGRGEREQEDAERLQPQWARTRHSWEARGMREDQAGGASEGWQQVGCPRAKANFWKRSELGQGGVSPSSAPPCGHCVTPAWRKRSHEGSTRRLSAASACKERESRPWQLLLMEMECSGKFDLLQKFNKLILVGVDYLLESSDFGWIAWASILCGIFWKGFYLHISKYGYGYLILYFENLKIFSGITHKGISLGSYVTMLFTKSNKSNPWKHFLACIMITML